VQIGWNLWTFLHRFRQVYPRGEFWLWIDALCINQSKVQERNHQVGQMKDIYTQAAKMIVWLGKSDAHDEEAFGSLETYQPTMHAFQRNSWSSWDAWYHLSRKPYWRRVWIIQELILAKEAYLWCGEMRANSADFKRIGDALDGAHTIKDTPG
jgi:hypothetical protein